MDAIQDFIDFNKAAGMTVNGIKAQRLPGRGIGFVASRKLPVQPTHPRSLPLS